MTPAARQATLQIVLGTVFWGFGFVATKLAIVEIGPMWMTILRFALAGLVCLPAIAFLPSLRSGLTREQIRLALLPGLFLAGLLQLQTIGLKYTTVTNSGFITTLYVVFVPLMTALLWRRRVPGRHWLLVALALAGTALMCRWESFAWNAGDFLTLGAALSAATHIILLERSGPRITAPFTFNILQTAWAALWSVPFAFLLEPLSVRMLAHPPATAVLGVLFLIGPCTIVAYSWQVTAQRVLPAMVVSLLFLLEAPFAAFFGWLVLGEAPSVAQWMGALLILCAAGAASASEAGASPAA